MASDGAYMASVDLWAGNYAPRNWSFCLGQLIAIPENPALYSLLSTTFGGDGHTTFGLPDMRGKVAVGTGQHPGLTNRFLGDMGGAETEILTIAQMPAHTHQAVFTPAGVGNLSASLSLPVKTGIGTGTSDPTGKYFGNSGSTGIYYSDYTNNATMAQVPVDLQGATCGGTVTVGVTGSSSSFSVMQPFLALNFIICTSGIYPPRDNN